jgi:hypothetical protein
MTPLLRLIVIAFLLFAAASCKKNPPAKTKEQVMQERFQNRLDQWLADLRKNCEKRVLDRAVAIVDSSLIANARENRDATGIYLPSRPGEPDIFIPVDSLPVLPLFFGEDSLLQDSFRN